jgi:hypothetical protein
VKVKKLSLLEEVKRKEMKFKEFSLHDFEKGLFCFRNSIRLLISRTIAWTRSICTCLACQGKRER